MTIEIHILQIQGIEIIYLVQIMITIIIIDVMMIEVGEIPIEIVVIGIEIETNQEIKKETNIRIEIMMTIIQGKI